MYKQREILPLKMQYKLVEIRARLCLVDEVANQNTQKPNNRHKQQRKSTDTTTCVGSLFPRQFLVKMRIYFYIIYSYYIARMRRDKTRKLQSYRTEGSLSWYWYVTDFIIAKSQINDLNEKYTNKEITIWIPSTFTLYF